MPDCHWPRCLGTLLPPAKEEALKVLKGAGLVTAIQCLLLPPTSRPVFHVFWDPILYNGNRGFSMGVTTERFHGRTCSASGNSGSLCMLRWKTGTESSGPEENTRERSRAETAKDSGLCPLSFLIPPGLSTLRHSQKRPSPSRVSPGQWEGRAWAGKLEIRDLSL